MKKFIKLHYIHIRLLYSKYDIREKRMKLSNYKILTESLEKFQSDSLPIAQILICLRKIKEITGSF